MKALTVWQPWASLLAAGVKRYETRSWSTGYRGELAIHAAKRAPRPRELNAPAIRGAMIDAGMGPHGGAWDIPRGRVLAVAELVSVTETDVVRDVVGGRELELGDWSPGRYAWELSVVTRLEPPVPARGRQRLWTWTPPGGVAG